MCCCLGSLTEEWGLSDGELGGCWSLGCKSTSSARGGRVGECMEKLCGCWDLVGSTTGVLEVDA